MGLNETVKVYMNYDTKLSNHFTSLKVTLFYLVDGNQTFKAIQDKIFGGQLDEVIADQCEIKQMGCNFPYDFGPICKYQAAAFYALSDIVDNSQSQGFEIEHLLLNAVYIEKIYKIFGDNQASLVDNDL